MQRLKAGGVNDGTRQQRRRRGEMNDQRAAFPTSSKDHRIDNLTLCELFIRFWRESAPRRPASAAPEVDAFTAAGV